MLVNEQYDSDWLDISSTSVWLSESYHCEFVQWTTWSSCFFQITHKQSLATKSHHLTPVFNWAASLLGWAQSVTIFHCHFWRFSTSIFIHLQNGSPLSTEDRRQSLEEGRVPETVESVNKWPMCTNILSGFVWWIRCLRNHRHKTAPSIDRRACIKHNRAL